MLEGNKSIRSLLFYKSNVSLFSLYQSLCHDILYAIFFSFLFKRQQARYNVFQEHNDHSQNRIVINEMISQNLNKHSISAGKCQFFCFKRAKVSLDPSWCFSFCMMDLFWNLPRSFILIPIERCMLNCKWHQWCNSAR